MNKTSALKSEGWGRLPSKPGDRIQGLSRAHVYNLINAGQIKSACIRQPGCTTGVRLVYLPSLLQYIEKHVEKHVEPDASTPSGRG